MSLDTLLEAAKYIEYRSEAKARGEVPEDYHTFVSHSSNDNNNGGPVFVLPSYSSSNNDDNSPGFYDDAKDRRRSGGAGTREVHNKLEKNRRAHLKKCFETLKRQIPNVDDKKTSNLGVLRSAFRCVQNLQKREAEYEMEVERLNREKFNLQQRLKFLRRDLSQKLDQVQINTLLIDRDHECDPDPDNDTNSTSTATECGPLSDVEDDKISDISQESISVSATDSTGVDRDTNNHDVNDSLVETNNGTLVDAMTSANQKTNSLTLLAKSAEEVSLAAMKAAPVTPPRASPPKVVLTQSSQVAVRTIQPHVNPLSNNAVANGSPNVATLPQRTPVSTIAVPHSSIATNGNTVPTAAIKVLTPQSVRILAPGAATLASKAIAITTNASTTLTPTRVALATSGSPGTATVPLGALALAKAVPTIKRVTTLAPVQAASSPATITPSATMKGVLTTAASHGSIATGQLALKPNNVTQQPILAATAVNFQTAAPIATSSPSVAVPAPTVARQLVTAAMKPVTQVRSQVPQITQVMAPTTLVSPVGQVIPGGSIMAPMSVVSSMNRATMAQVISPSQLGKVMAAPFIKTVPLYHQQQLFPHLGAVSSQALGNPIVMVTTPNVVPATTTTAQVTLPGSR